MAKATIYFHAAMSNKEAAAVLLAPKHEIAGSAPFFKQKVKPDTALKGFRKVGQTLEMKGRHIQRKANKAIPRGPVFVKMWDMERVSHW